MRSTRLGGPLPSARPETSAALDYFEAFHDAYATACDVLGGSLDRHYSIAGQSVVIRFAGPALLAALTRAIAHLETGPAALPSLTICVWDSESSGVAVPEIPWDVQPFLDRDEMWGVKGERIRVVYEFAGGPRLNLFDRERRTAIFWSRSAQGTSFYERAAPFFRPLHWALGDRGLQLAHAAAIGNGRGGILVGGKSGSGKSTTTLACLAAGLDAAGDDYVMLADGDPPVAHSLYNKVKLFAAHLRLMLPALLPAVVNPEEMEAEKAVVQIDELYPGQLARSLPILAVVVPEVTGKKDSRLIATSSALGIKAIAPNTIFQLRWAGRILSGLPASCGGYRTTGSNWVATSRVSPRRYLDC